MTGLKCYSLIACVTVLLPCRTKAYTFGTLRAYGVECQFDERKMMARKLCRLLTSSCAVCLLYGWMVHERKDHVAFFLAALISIAHCTLCSSSNRIRDQSARIHHITNYNRWKKCFANLREGCEVCDLVLFVCRCAPPKR